MASLAGVIDALLLLFPAIITLFLSVPGICFPQDRTIVSRPVDSGGLKLTRAVICEEIKDGRPVNEGIIFSADMGKITCYTEFESVNKKTTIYHCWYFKDNLRAKKKPLVLNPPQWSTQSQIEPRETDKGPWRVEIVDDNGNILKTLRFSITD